MIKKIEKTDQIQVWDYVPESVVQNDSLLRENDSFVAYATDYRFVTYEGMKYLAVRLNACEIFTFEKFYPMDTGANDELLAMLETVRAIRFMDGAVDFSVVIGYNFQFRYRKIDGTNKYEIFDVEADPDSYLQNVSSFYNEDTILQDLNWTEINDNEFILMKEDIDHDK